VCSPIRSARTVGSLADVTDAATLDEDLDARLFRQLGSTDDDLPVVVEPKGAGRLETYLPKEGERTNARSQAVMPWRRSSSLRMACPRHNERSTSDRMRKPLIVQPGWTAQAGDRLQQVFLPIR